MVFQVSRVISLLHFFLVYGGDSLHGSRVQMIYTVVFYCVDFLQLVTLKNTVEPCCIKRGLNASAKSVDPCQPALSAQADMGRHFLLSVNFLYAEGPFYHMIQTFVRQKWNLQIPCYLIICLLYCFTKMHCAPFARIVTHLFTRKR